jgi:hypothetical protein
LTDFPFIEFFMEILFQNEIILLWTFYGNFQIQFYINTLSPHISNRFISKNFQTKNVELIIFYFLFLPKTFQLILKRISFETISLMLFQKIKSKSKKFGSGLWISEQTDENNFFEIKFISFR